jgi:acyl-CoA thioester hydrolase
VGFSHTPRLRVRYCECDMQGRVFNAHWLTYFDLAATELCRAAVDSTTAFTARREDTLLVEGRLVQVVVEPQTFASTPIPEWVRQALA